MDIFKGRTHTNEKKQMPDMFKESKGKHILSFVVSTVRNFYHLKCVDFNTKQLSANWFCPACQFQSLPFYKINEDDLLLTVHGLDHASVEKLRNVPSFNIQSLLDKMPGQKFDTDEFLGQSIESKYFTPAQFLTEKIL